jgi:hypothetical protein
MKVNIIAPAIKTIDACMREAFLSLVILNEVKNPELFFL